MGTLLVTTSIDKIVSFLKTECSDLVSDDYSNEGLTFFDELCIKWQSMTFKEINPMLGDYITDMVEKEALKYEDIEEAKRLIKEELSDILNERYSWLAEKAKLPWWEE